LFNAENPLLNNYQNQEVFLKKAIPISQEKPINMLLNEELKTQILVSCGQSEIDTEIQIINPETLMPSQANEIGEIWVRGLTVSQGYWNNPSASELTFKAYRSDTKEGPFLRTGDLGFLYQGQLFVTGRLKDLIIIEGRNHYPQDIESTVENTDLALRKEACAAFSVEIKGEERLVIVAEIERSYDRKIDEVALKKKIREAVALEHDIRGDKIALIRYNCLPKTSSGKIQRQLCRSLFLNGELELLTSEPENLNSLTLSQNKTLQEIC
jgi:acyl-CoA synthetase (AMP-forming)/AMP-acid ligase II